TISHGRLSAGARGLYRAGFLIRDRSWLSCAAHFRHRLLDSFDRHSGLFDLAPPGREGSVANLFNVSQNRKTLVGVRKHTAQLALFEVLNHLHHLLTT